MNTQRGNAGIELRVPLTTGGKRYFFDPYSDTFFVSDGKDGRERKRIDQREMPVCYYIIEPATLCVFGSGSFVAGLGHFTPASNGYPIFDWQPGRDWDFYNVLVIFSPYVEMNWHYHGIEEMQRVPSAHFSEYLHDEPPRRELPDYADIMARLRPPVKSGSSQPSGNAVPRPVRHTVKAPAQTALQAIPSISGRRCGSTPLRHDSH